MIIVVIIIIIILILICVVYNNNSEHLTPTEAVTNIASLYNNSTLTSTNMNVTDKLTVSGNTSMNGGASINGNTSIAGALDITGNVTLSEAKIGGNTIVTSEGLKANGVMTSTIVPNSNNELIIGSEETDLIIRRKIYKLDGNSSGGDLSGMMSGGNISLQDAIKRCEKSTICDRVTTDNNGNYWLKNTNDWRYLVGSFNWPEDAVFTGSIYYLPNCPTGITSQEECMQKAKNNNSSNWMYAPTLQQCCMWNDGDNYNESNMTTYYLKKF